MKGKMKEGLIEQKSVDQKMPRGETKKGQRPVCKKGKVSSDRGKFSFK